MTREEFETECRRRCPHCAGGHQPRYRPETREWIHDKRSASNISITLCHASVFRNEQQGKEFSSG